ncbi:SF0329 family protein [Papillibacter cinnamivorans]|uniref:Uncharacterized protein n=1 Tax=Papillibacter cinnamivorans DSM 12816 TaxID=1122930 RepID=A0A1W1ZIT0_9FIRM|nr:hypothetical protein [Papillibacter cinnamivorans]SMC48287.1 hypothetical protein SAMN02745168_1146 [Papillibacter cinnamivorans DSM 12816]
MLERYKERYKSWSNIKKKAEGLICDSLQQRITYFYTSYHDVHDAYGRAAIRLDGKELVCFSWIERYRQGQDISAFRNDDPEIKYKDTNEKLQAICKKHKPTWDTNCTYCESDFIAAVQRFFHLPIEDALSDDDFIIRILSILNRRTGKRTVKRIKESGEYLDYPDWVQPFYRLRFDVEAI